MKPTNQQNLSVLQSQLLKERSKRAKAEAELAAYKKAISLILPPLIFCLYFLQKTQAF